jgi:hypothetical protein
MTLAVFGEDGLVGQFRDMVREELGRHLGRRLELAARSGASAAIASGDMPDSLFQASTPVQRRFWNFLAEVIRDDATVVEVRIVDDEHPPLFGQARAAQQVLDLTDLRALAPGNQAYSRAGVITHEIAERLFLTRAGFVYDASMSDEEFFRYWYLPAHGYASERETEVTGWRRTEEIGEHGETTSEWLREGLRSVAAGLPPSPRPRPARFDVTLEETHPPPWRSRRHRHATITGGGLEETVVTEGPALPRGPLGVE